MCTAMGLRGAMVLEMLEGRVEDRDCVADGVVVGGSVGVDGIEAARE